MSDSLRDQLLQAGFKETRKPQKKSRPARPGKPGERAPASRSAEAQQDRATDPSAPGTKRHPTGTAGKSRYALARERSLAEQQRQREKVQQKNQRRLQRQQIKQLIDTHQIKDYQGDLTWHYSLGRKIRQLMIKPDLKPQLTSGEIVITRFEGVTCLIPDSVATEILAIQPGWQIVRPTPESSGGTDSDEYGDFPIPDDLQW